MRRRWRLTRRRREPGGGTSLFPFLAVLICTMGALILLLVVIARQARIQAAQVENEEIARNEGNIAREQEYADWLTGELLVSREMTAKDLAEARVKLGHIEEHAALLRRRLEELRTAWADLESLSRNKDRHGETSPAELARLTAAIDRLKQEIDETEQKCARQPRSYAVVPYEGPHGTQRYPIYLECLADSVVIQPEGIVFSESDFAGPLDSGNPLDAALRAVREYLVRQQDRFGAEVEPYPLLLVRPSGIGAYYAARGAMKSWGTEFGYELIGDDWPLAFEPPDQELARAVHDATEASRRRQRLLAAVAPSQFDRQQRPLYRVSPHRGGVVRHGGADEDDSQGFLPSQAARRFGQDLGNLPSKESGTAGGGNDADSAKTTAKTSAKIAPAASSAKKLATIRGRDWGLPDATAGSIPVTRPIRVECRVDRLVVGPSSGPAAQQIVPVSGMIEPSIDTFVSSIWDRMESWGIAGRGMYWRPVLNVYVSPAAESGFRELEILLKDSGLAVRRAGVIDVR